MPKGERGRPRRGLFQKRKRENLSPAHSEHMGPSNRKHSQYTYSRMVYSTYYGNILFAPTAIPRHKNPTTTTQCSLECIKKKKTKEQTFFNTASTRKCVYTPFSRGSFTEGRIAIYRRPVQYILTLLGTCVFGYLWRACDTGTYMLN